MKRLNAVLVALLLASVAYSLGARAQSTFNKFQPANGVQCNTGLTYIDTACAAAAIPAAGSTTQMIYNLAGVYTGNAQATVAGDLGLIIGSATGGSKGPGTINATALYINGAAVGTSSGAVSSVALADGSSTPIYTITGSPVTAAGTLTETLNSQSAHAVFAGPTTGTAQPTFRALVAADVPTLNQNTTGNAATATALAANPTDCTTNQYATAIDASGNLTCAQVAYSQITGTPTVPTGANPSGLIGLSAVNGSATTFTRSDSTHALDLSIAPTWTGSHLFGGSPVTGVSTGGVSLGFLGGSAPVVSWISSGASANNRLWLGAVDGTGNWILETSNDAVSVQKTALEVTRSGATVGSVQIGNATDLPAIALDGPTTIAAPSSGTALVINATPGVQAESILAGAGQFAAISLAGNGATPFSNSFDIYQDSGNIATLRQSSTADMVFIANGTSRMDFSSSATTIAVPSGVPFAVSRTVGGTVEFQVTNAGSVGMPGLGTSTSAQTGYLCWSATGGALTVDTTNTCLVSSERYKQNITGLDKGLDAVMNLRPVTYEYKTGFMPAGMDPGRQLGFVAEEVQKVDPRLVPLDGEGKPKSVEYDRVTALLVKAVQEQQQEIWTLRAALLGFMLVSLTWLSALTWTRKS